MLEGIEKMLSIQVNEKISAIQIEGIADIVNPGVNGTLWNVHYLGNICVSRCLTTPANLMNNLLHPGFVEGQLAE